jgi:RNA polymerase sigma-70 factor, ECF subfamily
MNPGGKRESTLAPRESNNTGRGGESRQAQAVAEPPSTGRDSDEALAEQAAAGDSSAFDTLIVRYQDRVFNLLTRFCGTAEEAEDLAQESFLKAYRALSGFRQGSRFYTWLFRIAVNTALSRRRQDVRRKTKEAVRLDAPSGDGESNLKDVIADPAGSDPVDQMDREMIRQRVRDGLEEIDEDYRNILLLRDMEGMDYDAIADTLSISRAAVKSRLHRARIEMARILKDLKPQ